MTLSRNTCKLPAFIMIKPNLLPIVLFALLLLAGPPRLSAQQRQQTTQPEDALPIISAVVATPPDLPTIGKWMIDRSGTTAHWLGELYESKRLYEPINVIVVDAAAASAKDAKERLVAAVKTAGYPVRFGHSTGYRGLIGGSLYDQLPQGRDDAFSNRIFEETNNHGRVFGPHRFGDAFVFIGAFSRERVNMLEWPAHRYGSFTEARDDFARQLDAKTGFKLLGRVSLDNAIADDPDITTGDHDGRAVLLRAGQ